MALGLLLHPLFGINNQESRIGIGCPRNHILEELLMSRGIDDDILPFLRRKLDLGRINRDALFLLFLKGIEEIGILKGLARFPGDALDLVHCALGQGIRIVEQTADDRRFAMIHMTDHHDMQNFLFQFLIHYIYPSFRSFCIA